MKEAYVSFKVAKLFKEKGFHWPTCYYTLDQKVFCGIGHGSPIDHNMSHTSLSVPTQQMACRWLREEKGIHIMVSTGMDVDRKPMRFYHANLAQMEEDKTIYGDPIDVDFDTYEEAVEEALKYVLTNLI